MERWIRISSFAGCLLAIGAVAGGPGTRLEAQSTIVANEGARRLNIVTHEYCDETQSTTFFPLISGSIAIPAGWTSGRIVARFSAQSNCSYASYCSVQLLVNGALMSPGSGYDYAFDAPAPPELGSNFESNSVERTSGPLGPGTYTVEVQGAQVGEDPPSGLAICGATLSLTLWRVS